MPFGWDRHDERANRYKRTSAACMGNIHTANVFATIANLANDVLASGTVLPAGPKWQ